MNESDSHPVSPTPPAPAGGRPSDRKRLFTPIDRDGVGDSRPLARLAPVSALIRPTHPSPHGEPELVTDDLDSPVEPVPGRSPTLVPNKAIPFLQRVHAGSQPEAMERRFSAATRAAAFATLGVAVAVVIAASIALRAPASKSRLAPRPTEPAISVVAAATVPAASPEDVADALATLKAFLTAPTHEARLRLADSPLPPVAADGESNVAALSRAEIQADQARPIQAGARPVVLVPLRDAAGLPRTAALIRHDAHWRVDWRSAFTPESRSWEEFLSQPRRSPGLFRVLLSQESDGSWTAARASSPGAARLPVTFTPGSRAAAELAQAIAAQNGQPLAADVYLTAQADRTLNILDWTRDKWSL